MTTVQETTIAQNAAIIKLLKNIYDVHATYKLPDDTAKAIKIADAAAAGWLEQLEGK